MWKIAIIDDDRSILQGMKRTIPWEELEAEHVGDALDGEQGLELIRAQRPDVVITDIYMPVMNGLDMIAELQRTGYQGKIIILSGFTDFEYARQALRLSVDDYLSKPVTTQTIKSALEKAIAELEDASIQKLEHEELKHKLMQYEPFLEQEWIKAVVTGNLTPGKAYPAAFQHSPLWTQSHFVVLAVEMVRNERISEVSPSSFNLFRFAVGNVLQEVISSEWKEARMIELHSHQLAVLLHVNQGEQPLALPQILELCKSMICHVHDFLKVKLEVGIGSWKDRLQDIADSTEEAFQALAAKKNAVFPGLPLYAYKMDKHPFGSISSPKPITGEFRPVLFFQQLGEVIRLLQETPIREVIERFLRPLETELQLSKEHIHDLGLETWTILTYSLYDAGVRADELFAPEQIKAELAVLASAGALKDWLYEKVGVLCRLSGKSEKLKHKQAVDFMIQYIHQHYAEDLHLSDLAEKVYISRNYLSNIFRQAKGETFNNYVTRIRMEKAKSLILEGRWMIYEVAEMVGYKNIPYFTTLFKRYTGANPTEFIKN